jgi:hypothetical protein
MAKEDLLEAEEHFCKGTREGIGVLLKNCQSFCDFFNQY